MPQEPRLLPRSGRDGKHCYLITDDGSGPVSRWADVMESIQLDMGQELVDHALALLPHTQLGDLRYLAERLTEALRDALRIAESRGRRLNHLDGQTATTLPDSTLRVIEGAAHMQVDGGDG